MGAIKYDLNGYFVREISRMVYTNRIVDEFRNRIDTLDCWSCEKQLVEFGQQGLMFEAWIVKTGTEVCIASLYAYTLQLDALEGLEEQLMYDIEQSYANHRYIQPQLQRQACEIRKDERFIKTSLCRLT